MFQTLFGDPNDRKIKSYDNLLSQINKLETETQKLEDQALKQKTDEFISKLKSGVIVASES